MALRRTSLLIAVAAVLAVAGAALVVQRSREAEVRRTRRAEVRRSREAEVRRWHEARVQRAQEAEAERARQTAVQRAHEAEVQRAREAAVQRAREAEVQRAREAEARGARETAARRAREGEVRRAFFDEVQPVPLTNCELQRFGEPNDGGYLLCGNLLGDVRAGYSYGISGYDGWGCDVSRRLRVAVHQYDCFDLREPSCPAGDTVFHPECVAGARVTEGGRLFDTMQSQFTRNGDAATHLVVKMDVEGAEWDSLLLAPDAVFQNIEQLNVEFHHVGMPQHVAVLKRLKQFFHVAHVHYNNASCSSAVRPLPSWAFEVLLVSKRIATVDASRLADGWSPLDAPNDPNRPDCQSLAR